MAAPEACETHKEASQPALPDLMTTLPQELFDQIYDGVVTTYPQAVVINESSGKPFARPIPSLLKVSRGVREQVLGSYYANTTFICCADVDSPDEFLALRFPESHLSESRISSIVLYDSPGECDCSECTKATLWNGYLEEWRDACGDHTKIEGYYWEDQLYAALARENIKVLETA